MLKNNLDALDKVLKEKENNLKKWTPELNKQAHVIKRLDDTIEYHEKKIKLLEEQKKDELEKMQELFDSAVINSHTVGDYKIYASLSRKMDIADVPAFLKWLKLNCTPDEVIEFFTDALKATNLKRFVERQADKQRLKGEMNPIIDGIDLGDITYRRLTTKKGKN